jgi:hypothetical protein
MLARLRQQPHVGRVVGGWEAITAWLLGRLDRRRAGRSQYLLVGSYHDSGAQVAAFGRLVGPFGLKGLRAVVAEAFYADGQWAGVPAELQQADTRSLQTFLESGERAAWDQLLQTQRRENHTAWKYRYLPTVMELVSSARASGQRFLACDLLPQLQPDFSAQGAEGEALVLRVRELHCLLSIERALVATPAARRVAMLWGQAHVTPEGIARFLPRDADVLSIYLFGFRPGEHGIERDLEHRLKTTAPLLVALDDTETQLALLLPGPRLEAKLDLARDRLDAPIPPEQRHLLSVTTTQPGLLVIAGQSHAVEEEKVTELVPGAHAWRFEREE